MIEKLIEIRNKIKSKMPNFRTHDSHKKKRVSSTTWRKPKGRQNKVRLNRKGYVRQPSTGFSSPKLVRGLSRNGLTQNLILSMSDFNNLNPKTDGVIISSNLGKLKKKIYLDHATKNNFTVLNLNVEKFNKNYEQFLANKKEVKETMKARKKSQETKLKKADTKKEETKEETKKEKKKETEVKEETKEEKKKETEVKEENKNTELKSESNKNTGDKK